MEEKKTDGLKAANSFVLWAGRLEEKPDDEAFAFQASLGFDRRFVFEDIEGSRAHCAMLGKQGIIPSVAAAALDAGLKEIAEDLKSGRLCVDAGAVEDVHSYIEGLLTERLGDAGRMLHSGRSRNDQTVLDLKLYLKNAISGIDSALVNAISALLELAERHAGSIMPEYTHLQRAQCGTLGHYLAGWACALSRDRERFYDAKRRLDECPLGSCALAGTSLPLDREYTAGRLGFARVSLNSLDSVSDRDFVIETASCCAITQTHLSRFCEDLVLWASEEFGFISFAEKWSTGSSIMPQKKNPDFAELIRGKAGRTAGNLVTLLTIMKGLPYAYGKDLQEDKEAVFDSIDTLLMSLNCFSSMLKSASPDLKRMEDACTGGFLEATDAAEYLVKKGLPFRLAHEVSALLVRDAIAAGQRSLRERTLSQFKERSPLFEEDIYERLLPVSCVRARALPGGPAPEEVLRQIKVLRDRLLEHN